MRIAVAALALAIAAAQQSVPRWRELNQTARQAAQAKDYERLQKVLQELQPLMPGNPRIVYNLANSAARLNQSAVAIALLFDLAAMGQVYDLAADEDFQSIRESCPYDIPRRNEATGLMAKCTMCFERITNGMLPACVKVCPTGTMNFGEREAMMELANKRLAEVKKTFPRAMLANPEDVSVIFLLQDDPKYYPKTAVAENDAPAPLDRKAFLAKVMRPLRAFG